MRISNDRPIRTYEDGIDNASIGPMQASVRDPETYQIIGAAMDVHRTLRRGFLESIYRAALKLELERRSVPTAMEVPFRVHYKGDILPVLFRADLVCFNRVIVEVKASVALGKADVAQTINYLRVSSLQKALLLNFGLGSLQYQRVVL
jgi:GxxExxY protein